MRISQELKDKYRERLKKIIAKKFDTTMIYPLSQFEMAFGEIWGLDKPTDRLSDQEKSMRAKWNQCRNNILNLGNQQKRNALTEVDEHEVEKRQYQTVFLPQDKFNNPTEIEEIEKRLDELDEKNYNN